MKNFAQKHPYIFALITLLVSLVFLILAKLPTVPFANQMGIATIIGGVGRVLVSLPFVYLLSRFGWLKEAGFRLPQEKKGWLWVVLVIPYLVLAFLLPTYKSISFDFSDLLLVFGTIVFTFGVGMYEETVYRGVIQTLFYKKWIGIPHGILRAVIVSAIYFGVLHLANLAGGADLLLTVAQVVYTIGLGILFGALLVYGKSIWPAIIMHWLMDCASGLISIGKTAESNTLFLSLVFLGAVLPLGLLAFWLLQKAQNQEKSA
jgi:membrane protease YdiL (CAAX protease family)